MARDHVSYSHCYFVDCKKINGHVYYYYPLPARPWYGLINAKSNYFACGGCNKRVFAM